jgi:hypothetical protein
MDENCEQRLAALERALTDGDHDLSALADEAATADRLDALDAEVESLADRVTELEAATQALRGYVGNVRAVNEEVQQRADLAVSKAEQAHEAATATGRNGVSRHGGSERAGAPAPSTDTDEGRPLAGAPTLDDGFETPRTDGLGTDPADLAAEPDGGTVPDSQDDPGIVARIRALL